MTENIAAAFIQQRRSKVIGYYRAGFTVSTISKVLSTDERIVRDDLAASLKQLESNISFTQQQIIALQYERLSYLDEKLSPGISKGDIRAIRTAIDITSAKCKLLGLYKAEPTQNDDFPLDISALSPEEIAEATETSSIPESVTSENIKTLSDEELKKEYFNSLNRLGKR